MSGYRRFLTPLGRRQVLQLIASGAALGMAACAAPAPTPTQPAAPPPPTPSPAAPAAAKPAAQPTVAPQPSAPTAAPATKTASRFRMAIPDLKFDTVYQMMALEQGLYREVGIDAEIVPVAGGVEPIRGLVAGDFDYVEHGSTAMFSALEQGAPVVFVGTIFLRFPHQMYTKKEITDLRQLYGRPFGMSQAGDSFEAMPRAVFAKHDLDQSQLNLIPVGGSVANFQALVAGKVDACTSALEQMQLLEQNPGWDAKVFLAYGEELPNYMRTGGLVSQRGLSDSKSLLTQALLAHTRGARYALDHKSEAVAWAVEKAGTQEDVADWAFDQYARLGLVNADFALTAEAVAFTQDTHLQVGMQKTRIDVAKALDTSIQEQILSTLGTYAG